MSTFTNLTDESWIKAEEQVEFGLFTNASTNLVELFDNGPDEDTPELIAVKISARERQLTETVPTDQHLAMAARCMVASDWSLEFMDAWSKSMVISPAFLTAYMIRQTDLATRIVVRLRESGEIDEIAFLISELVVCRDCIDGLSSMFSVYINHLHDELIMGGHINDVSQLPDKLGMLDIPLAAKDCYRGAVVSKIKSEKFTAAIQSTLEKIQQEISRNASV